MIEEAAGTRMYECKKISAQKTIEKKEAKLKEIQTVCLLIYLLLAKEIFIYTFQICIIYNYECIASICNLQ